MTEKHVALLIETSTSWGANIVKGIADYAASHANWYFYLEPRGKYERLTLPRDWTGDGVIARVTYEELAREIVATGKPAVNVSWYSFDSVTIPTCTSDEGQAGQMIAGHFLDRGFKQFAYCGPMNRPEYSDLFGRAFLAAIADAGFTCHRFDPPDAAQHPVDWSTRLRLLGDWLETLPTPIGILAFSDIGGRQVAEACRQRRLRIPDQVALMGGEHDELTCQITRPPLSSIDLCPQKIGWEAAKLLARMFAGEAPPIEPIRIPPARIIVRQSTDTLAIDEPMLGQALEFIAKNAFRGITVSDVLEAVPISRRVLEQRMKQHLGRTPAGEIRRIRIENAKRLLADTDRSLNDIASACGFDHPEVLTRVFRRQEGMTPSSYRKQSRGSD